MRISVLWRGTAIKHECMTWHVSAPFASRSPPAAQHVWGTNCLFFRGRVYLCFSLLRKRAYTNMLRRYAVCTYTYVRTSVTQSCLCVTRVCSANSHKTSPRSTPCLLFVERTKTPTHPQVTQLSKSPMRSPLAVCLLIRYMSKILHDDISATNARAAYQVCRCRSS